MAKNTNTTEHVVALALERLRYMREWYPEEDAWCEAIDSMMEDYNRRIKNGE